MIWCLKTFIYTFVFRWKCCVCWTHWVRRRKCVFGALQTILEPEREREKRTPLFFWLLHFLFFRLLRFRFPFALGGCSLAQWRVYRYSIRFLGSMFVHWIAFSFCHKTNTWWQFHWKTIHTHTHTACEWNGHISNSLDGKQNNTFLRTIRRATFASLCSLFVLNKTRTTEIDVNW